MRRPSFYRKRSKVFPNVPFTSDWNVIDTIWNGCVWSDLLVRPLPRVFQRERGHGRHEDEWLKRTHEWLLGNVNHQPFTMQIGGPPLFRLQQGSTFALPCCTRSFDVASGCYHIYLYRIAHVLALPRFHAAIVNLNSWFINEALSVVIVKSM